jgi:cytochrome d ubiquinol oxidase subunit II
MLLTVAESVHHGYWNLQTLWFGLILVLWVGYFVLEGFDFGVGMLLRLVGGDEPSRRAVLRTIGPVWDGNEVWLIVAGGATFAAFPNWYASLFSGFYLALFLILVGLIVRGVAIEYRNKHAGERWRARWDTAIVVSSAVPALLWGVAFANVLQGVPIDANGEYTGTLLTLLNPYGLYGGLTTLTLFALHGATFLSLRTSGNVRERSRRLALWLALPTAGVVFGFLTWTYLNAVHGGGKGIVPGVVPVMALLLALVVSALLRAKHEGFAFAATTLTIGLIVVTIFLNLYPRVLVSSTNPDWSLTIWSSSSSHYTLGVMSVVALLFTPLVLAYQGWTYWVFRQRVLPDREPAKSLGAREGAAGPEGKAP